MCQSAGHCSINFAMHCIYPWWVAHCRQQCSCHAVPLLCGQEAVQGASPYTPPHQTGPTCWAPVVCMPTINYHLIMGGLPMLSHSFNQTDCGWSDEAQNSADIQGPGTVHAASKAFTVTHVHACTDPVRPWHGPDCLHGSIHHVLAHIQST